MGHRTWGARRPWIWLMPIGIAIVLASPPAFAETPSDQGMEIGPWRASALASGRAILKAQGIKVDWRGEVPAQFTFAVSEDGSAAGTWKHQGEASQVISGRVGGRRVKGTADIDFSGGGKVRGNDHLLRLSGSSRQRGDMTLTGAGGSTAFDVSQNTKIPKLKMRVTSTTCDEAYGEWAYTLRQAIQKQGFRASLDGYWLGFRDSEAVNAEVEKLLEAARLQGEAAPSFDSGSPLLDLAGALLRRYNDFVDRFPNWPIDQVADLFGDTENILNSIRNLTECDRRLFGEDNVEQFTSGLTLVLQNLITSTANLGGMSGQQWQLLAQAAFRAGVLGPGAANPAMAVAAEQALIDAAEGILASNVDLEDGRIWVNDETMAVMGMAAASGWSLNVDGTTYDARSTWSDAFGDTWPQDP